MKIQCSAIFAIIFFVLSVSSCGGNIPAVAEKSKRSETLDVYEIRSKAIAAGRLEKKNVTSVFVSLPASYASSPKRRYPVVYGLHGFGEGALSILNNLRDSFNRAGSAAPDVIVVSVEGGNSLGGSFFADSPATGNWQSLVTVETVALVDARYRTIAAPEGRMIAGFSMGGAGAWNIAIEHPEVFSAAWVCCPGAWDRNGLRDTLSGWDSTYRNAYGAAFSPDFSLPSPYAAVPKFDGTYGDSLVIEQWERGFGGIDEKIAAYGKMTAKLKAVSFVYGMRDPYGWIPRGTQYIAERMRLAGLPVEIRAFNAGHAVTDEMLSESFLPLVRSMFGGIGAK